MYQLGVQVRLKERKEGDGEAKGEPEGAPGEDVGIREKAPKRADWLSDAPHRRRHCPHEAKPPVPATCCSRFVRLERGEKDFVMDNTISALREPAKIPYPRYVDSPRGTARDWCRSGLARKYVMKSDFGTVPEYLSARKQELKAREEAERRKEEEERRRAIERCRPLSDEERQKLIAGLQRHWNDVYNEFQSFPLVVDRPLAIKSKAELERRLKEIEKDIQFLKDHNYIFASDAQKTFYLH